MADRRFSVRHLPGVSLIAGMTFVALYAPILILVINAFNAGSVIGRWEGARWTRCSVECGPDVA